MFRSNSADITHQNLKVLRITLLGTVCMLLLSSLSCIVSPDRMIRLPVYFSDAAIFLAIVIISFTKAAKNKNFTIAGIIIHENLLLATALIFDIFFKKPTEASTVYFIAFVTSAFFYIVTPIYLKILIPAWTVLFITCDILVKTPAIALADTVDCLCIALSCCIIGSITNNARIYEIESKRRLTVQRDTDPLTKLPNRRKLFETLRKTNEEGTLRGLIMADIDYFKQYNDTFGHRAGDICLHAIGQVMKKLSADFGCSFFRYGGEEFMVIVTSMTDLHTIASRIVREIYGLDIAGSKKSIDGRITMSCGYAYMSECPAGGYEDLIKLADKALYAAKADGRNTTASRTDIRLQENAFDSSFEK